MMPMGIYNILGPESLLSMVYQNLIAIPSRIRSIVPLTLISRSWASHWHGHGKLVRTHSSGVHAICSPLEERVPSIYLMEIPWSWSVTLTRPLSVRHWNSYFPEDLSIIRPRLIVLNSGIYSSYNAAWLSMRSNILTPRNWRATSHLVDVPESEYVKFKSTTYSFSRISLDLQQSSFEYRETLQVTPLKFEPNEDIIPQDFANFIKGLFGVRN